MVYFFVGLFISLIIGTVFGFIFGATRNQPTSGTLRIDNSDPSESPYLFVELKCDPMALKELPYVTFEVNAENYVPRDSQ